MSHHNSNAAANAFHSGHDQSSSRGSQSSSGGRGPGSGPGPGHGGGRSSGDTFGIGPPHHKHGGHPVGHRTARPDPNSAAALSEAQAVKHFDLMLCKLYMDGFFNDGKHQEFSQLFKYPDQPEKFNYRNLHYHLFSGELYHLFSEYLCTATHLNSTKRLMLSTADRYLSAIKSAAELEAKSTLTHCQGFYPATV